MCSTSADYGVQNRINSTFSGAYSSLPSFKWQARRVTHSMVPNSPGGWFLALFPLETLIITTCPTLTPTLENWNNVLWFVFLLPSSRTEPVSSPAAAHQRNPKNAADVPVQRKEWETATTELLQSFVSHRGRGGPPPSTVSFLWPAVLLAVWGCVKGAGAKRRTPLLLMWFMTPCRWSRFGGRRAPLVEHTAAHFPQDPFESAPLGSRSRTKWPD